MGKKMVFTQNAVDRIFDNNVKNYRDKFNVTILQERVSLLVGVGVVSGGNKKAPKKNT